MSMKIALLLVLAVAVIHDLWERRIPNYLIVAGLLIALGLSMAGGAAGGLGDCLAGLVLGMALFFPFFALGLVGAGDVKLFGVVGSFVGWEALLMVWFYTLVTGGVLGVVSVLVGRSSPLFFENMKLAFISLIYRVEGTAMSLKDMASRTSAKIPYAVAIAAGALIWMVRQS